MRSPAINRREKSVDVEGRLIDFPPASQYRLERTAQRLVPEHESVAERLVGNTRWPPSSNSLAKLPPTPAQQSAGNPENRGPMQPAAQFLGELRIGHGDRCGGVDRPCQFRLSPITCAIRRIRSSRSIQDIHCRPEPWRPAEAELERRQHSRDEAAVGADHKANPQADQRARHALPPDAPRFPRRRRAHG